MESIVKYFNGLSDHQIQQLSQLKSLYEEWNEKINVISRKDMDDFYLHHVLHSLTLTSFIKFASGTTILDLGCGGGFPGIPLAIFYPDVHFTLIDGTGKKIKVVQAVSDALELKNITAIHTRAESHKGQYHFVISRAVATLHELLNWSFDKWKKEQINALPNGLIAYKGGDLNLEIKDIKKGNYIEKWDIFDKFPEPYFTEKYLIYVQKK